MMKRREALAGAASLGVLAAGSAVAVRGPPSIGGDGNGADESTDAFEPIAVETLGLPWSDGESVDVPTEGRVTVVKFFATWCRSCWEMLPDVTEAHGRVGDDGQVTTADVEDWWDESGGGEWPVGSDETAELQVRHDVAGVPATVVFDADGVERYADVGVSTADELVDAIESARDGVQ